MTSVTFETATVRDVIAKAARIAPPPNNNVFEKCSGVLMEVHPDAGQVIVRATNLDVYYSEWVDTLEIDGDATQWRFPSKVLGAFMATLPIGSGKTVTFTSTPNAAVAITSAKTRSKLNTYRAADYPEWLPFDAEHMTDVPELGGRLAMVEWAASRHDHALGVRFDGEHVLATDRFKLAAAPLVIPSLRDHPAGGVTTPPGLLAGILRPKGATRIHVAEHQLHIMPDSATQIRTVLIGEKFPKTGPIFASRQTHTLHLRKTEAIDILNRVTKIAGSDAMPLVQIIIGHQQVAAYARADEHGHIGDILEVPGQADHDRVTLTFSAPNLSDAISNAPSEEVVLGYAPEQPRSLVHLDGGSGYQAWVAPRAETS